MMSPRTWIILAFLCLTAQVPLFGSTSANAAAAVVCGDDAVTTATFSDDCCDTRCPADQAPDRPCPTRCAYCSCSPGMSQVVLTAPGVTDFDGSPCAAVPPAEPQRATSTPLNIFRPPRIQPVCK